MPMGADGPGPFENDGAGGFVEEWASAGSEVKWQMFNDALTGVAEISQDDYVDKFEGEPAVAAAALIAAIIREDREVLDEYGLSEQEAIVSRSLASLALVALARIVGRNSEVLLLWEDSGGDEEWLGEIEKISSILKEYLDRPALY